MIYKTMADIKIELVNNINKMNKTEIENLIYILDKKHERSSPKIIKKTDNEKNNSYIGNLLDQDIKDNDVEESLNKNEIIDMKTDDKIIEDVKIDDKIIEDVKTDDKDIEYKKSLKDNIKKNIDDIEDIKDLEKIYNETNILLKNKKINQINTLLNMLIDISSIISNDNISNNLSEPLIKDEENINNILNNSSSINKLNDIDNVDEKISNTIIPTIIINDTSKKNKKVSFDPSIKNVEKIKGKKIKSLLSPEEILKRKEKKN